jgi:hypothetical protein
MGSFELFGYVYEVNSTFQFFSTSKPPEDAYDPGTLNEVYIKVKKEQSNEPTQS